MGRIVILVKRWGSLTSFDNGKTEKVKPSAKEFSVGVEIQRRIVEWHVRDTKDLIREDREKLKDSLMEKINLIAHDLGVQERERTLRHCTNVQRLEKLKL